MYKIVQKEFIAYNGEKFNFHYREDTNDYNTILSIIDNDEYKTSSITHPDVTTFVDIGAHIGIWSALMDRINPGANVVAVEPLPENVELIKLNANAEIIQKAAAGRDNLKIKIHYANDSFGGKHHKFVGNMAEMKGDKFYLADSISLKTLLEDIPHVRVLKIDCEGAEHVFFKFANKETLAKIDYIIGEYHNVPPQSAFKTRKALLSSMKGLFEDISTDKTERVFGQFFFKRNEL